MPFLLPGILSIKAFSRVRAMLSKHVFTGTAADASHSHYLYVSSSRVVGQFLQATGDYKS